MALSLLHVAYLIYDEYYVMQVAAIHLHPEAFTVENGLTTPTFKVKRPQLKQAFQKQLDAMYSKLEK